MKDKTYQQCPIGQEVRRFLQAFRWSGNEAVSADSYESVLARFAVDHSDMTLEEFASPVGTEYTMAFLDRHWAHCSLTTMGHHLTVQKAFFTWAVGERRMAYNPIGHVKRPRTRRSNRVAYPPSVVQRLIDAQDTLRDQCGIQLAGRLGLRKNELRVLQIKDIDLTRNLVTVHGKGGHVDVLPLEFEQLQQDLYLHIQAEGRRPSEYLLYPKSHRGRPMDHSSIHRWFKRCLGRAGLPDEIKLHEMRHAAADFMYRATSDVRKAQLLLRHTSVRTTELYLHAQPEDLAAAMRQVDAAWNAQSTSPVRDR